MADILLHQTTEQRIDQYLISPGHALLITGPAGIGKGVVLNHLASKLLGSKAEDNAKILRILALPDKQDIGVDAVRQIQHFIALKSVKNDARKPIQRVVLIEDAHKLTNEAQNALLKIIEEPPIDTVMLLSSVTARQLLPTVVSRVQEMTVTAPNTDELKTYLRTANYPTTEIDKAITMSGGLPGFTIELLNETSEHPMRQAAESARKLLGATKFERLLLIDVLTKQRDQAIATCDMLGWMASLMLKNPKLDHLQQQKWQNILKHSIAAGDQLRAYGQPKLVLTSLSLHL